MSFWTSNTLSIQLRGPHANQTIDLAQPYAIVGASDTCDVVLDSPKIAERAMLLLATRNGIRAVVLSKQAKEPGRLMKVSSDRPLKLHGYELTVLTNEEPIKAGEPTENTDANESQTSQNADTSPDTIFAITWKSKSTRQFVQLADSVPTLVGRKSAAKIVLENDRLSGLHCCLLREQESLWVIDLQSKNGTHIAGAQITCAPIEPGKSLVIGNQRLHFVRLHTDDVIGVLANEKDENAAANRQLVDGLLHDYLRVRSKAERDSESTHEVLESRECSLSELSEQVREIREENARLAEEKEGIQRQLDEVISASSERQAELLQQIEEHEQQAAAFQSEANTSAEAAREALREREDELERLTQELVTERRILNQLQIDIQPATSRPTIHPIEDESCISSFDFQEVLEEALESLPIIDDES